MTEVRSTSDRGHGLYATQEFHSGDVILEESPLLHLAPQTYDEIIKLRSQFPTLDTPDPPSPNNVANSSSSVKSSKAIKKQKKRERADAKARAQISASPLFDLILPSMIPSSLQNKARRMILALASYAICTEEDTKAKLLTLYAPTLAPDSSSSSSSLSCETQDPEAPLLQLTRDLISYLNPQDSSQSIIAPSSPLFQLLSIDPSTSQTVMLLWACNAFEGGRIYERTSRINHSCDFNAIVSSSPADSEMQIIRAVCPIAPGEEIHISYLGTWTYTEANVRKERLRRDKFFECACVRCTRESSEGDPAACIPCMKCHERQGRYLDEDAQYDDEGTVVYAKPFQGQKEKKEESYRCPTSKVEYEIPIEAELRGAMSKTIEKAMIHLDAGVENEDPDEEDEQWDFLERLSSLASSVLGAKHWCTNLLLLQQTEKRIATLHGTMLVSGTGGGDKKGSSSEQEGLLDMTEVAECIDQAERLWTFVKGLQLKSHPGHLLGSLIIGIARLLVGLGDEKSMKYGADWANKVNEEYYEKGFEGDGMKKVVNTLLNAWKRKAEDGEGGREETQKKKQRVK